jgi:7-carboxy-7-deazaguanine synthase (Cx14CxxC type)
MIPAQNNNDKDNFVQVGQYCQHARKLISTCSWSIINIEREKVNYSVKEIFYSLQSEGAQAGRPAVFCRFTGCNLWSGLEKDRDSSICGFCDTDFVGTNGAGGGMFGSSEELAAAIDLMWPPSGEEKARKLVVCTGGEPLLQLDAALLHVLHERGFEVAAETNGTLIPPEGIDWICVSPKANAELKLRKGNELKLVFPQKDLSPEAFRHLDFEYFSLQPMDGPDLKANIKKTVEYVMANPGWRLSLQIHKLLGIP